MDAAQAGVGKITCRIRTESGTDLDIDIIEQDDGTFSIAFTPQSPGPYTIEIKFGGEVIPNGSYTVQVSPLMAVSILIWFYFLMGGTFLFIFF